MERYYSYKDSGVEWIGEIPSHWGIEKIKRLYTERKEKNQELDTRFLSVMKDVGVIPYSEKGNVGNKTSDNIGNYKWVYEDDLVINPMNVIIGSVGVSRYRGVLSNVYIVLVSRAFFLSGYGGYVFQNKGFQQYLKRICYGIMELRESLNKIEFFTEKIPLPPPSEQEQIVEYLDRKTTLIDSLIEKTVRKIELLKEKRASLINEVVTKGLNPDVEMKDSGVEWIGEIPSHWVKKKLGYLVNIQGRVGYKGYKKTDLVDEGEGALVLGGKHINTQQRIDLSNPDYLSWEKYYESPEIMVRQGDMIVSQRGTLGKVVVVDKDFGPMTINPSLVVLNQVRESVKYLWYFIQSEVIQEVIVREGSVTTIPMLSQEEISSFPILVPAQEEQEQIVEYLDEQTSIIDSTITTEEKRIELLKEYRQSLISEVVTGKVKVAA